MNPIKQYFEAYYESLKTGSYIDPSRCFVLNAHTVIPQRLLLNKYKLYKAFDLSLEDYQVNLEFAEIKRYRNYIAVIVIENAQYKYKNVPNGLISKTQGIEYYIEMKRINGRWRIVYMDSNQEDYQMANERSNVYIHEKDYLSLKRSGRLLTQKGDCLNKVFDLLDEEISCLKKIVPVPSNMKFSEDENNKKNNVTIKDTDIYDPNKGIVYARKNALYSELPEKEKLFYYAYNGGDCTNFMSQCVWAAYGGYVEEDLKLTKKNISKKYRMVYTGNLNTSWYGTMPDGGGTPYWENVKQFYNYVTSPKEKGPKGKVYGSGKQADFDLNNVSPGNILQFWPANKERWYHSVYVTGVYSGGSVPHIYVCQHSMDMKDRPLVELLSWNTNEGKIRGISFSATSFNG